jgi:hypothetical protein
MGASTKIVKKEADRMGWKSKKMLCVIVFIGVLAVGFAGCVEEKEQNVPIENVPLVEETEHIKYGNYFSYSTVFKEGYKIQVTAEVKQGGPVDVLLLNSGDYLSFEDFTKGRRNTFNYFKTGSALDIMSKTYTFEVLSGDRYHIIINNGGGIEGGAKPTGDVAVYIKVIYPII